MGRSDRIVYDPGCPLDAFRAGIWVSDVADRMIFWPKPVCEWMMVEGRVSRWQEGRNMYARIGVPRGQAQTGKVWINGFSVESVESVE